MKNRKEEKYGWIISVPVFALVLSISPQAYCESLEFLQNDQRQYVPAISVDQVLSQQQNQDTGQNTPPSMMYDSPLSKVEATPLNESLTPEESEHVQDLLTDLEESIQESGTNGDANPTDEAALDTDDEASEIKKDETGVGDAGEHSKEQPVVTQLASLHDQLTELAIDRVRGGVRDVHTLVRKKYEMARKQILEEGFSEQIRTAELMSSEHKEKTDTENDKKPLENTDSGEATGTYSKELAATVALFTPPKNVHPFLRLVFYRSDPRIVKAYRNVRQEARAFRETAQWRKGLSRSYRHETPITEHRSLPLVPGVFKDEIISALHQRRGRFFEKIFGVR